MTSVVDADAVSFSYDREPVLDCVSLMIARGEFVALTGANGSGKSTLLRLLLGLLPPAAGSVRVLGAAPHRLRDRRKVGYVPQRSTLPDQLPATVAEVVATGRLVGGRWRRRLGPQDRSAVEGALRDVDLTELADRPVAELSGGQQQRVLIAKALVNDPELLILDEPVAGVDADSQRRFRDTLVGSVHHRGAAVLLVSHELGAVATDLDRVLVLRRGKLVFDGPPADLAATGVSLGVHDTDLPVWLEGLR